MTTDSNHFRIFNLIENQDEKDIINICNGIFALRGFGKLR